MAIINEFMLTEDHITHLKGLKVSCQDKSTLYIRDDQDLGGEECQKVHYSTQPGEIRVALQIVLSTQKFIPGHYVYSDISNRWLRKGYKDDIE